MIVTHSTPNVQQSGTYLPTFFVLTWISLMTRICKTLFALLDDFYQYSDSNVNNKCTKCLSIHCICYSKYNTFLVSLLFKRHVHDPMSFTTEEIFTIFFRRVFWLLVSIELAWSFFCHSCHQLLWWHSFLRWKRK